MVLERQTSGVDRNRILCSFYARKGHEMLAETGSEKVAIQLKASFLSRGWHPPYISHSDHLSWTLAEMHHIGAQPTCTGAWNERCAMLWHGCSCGAYSWVYKMVPNGSIAASLSCRWIFWCSASEVQRARRVRQCNAVHCRAALGFLVCVVHLTK